MASYKEEYDQANKLSACACHWAVEDVLLPKHYFNSALVYRHEKIKIGRVQIIRKIKGG